MKKYSLHYKHKFGLMTFYEHPIVYIVNMSIFIFPITLGYYSSICKLWITLWMFKRVIIDNSDIKALLYHKNLVNITIKEYLYFTNILDNSKKEKTKPQSEEEEEETSQESKNMSYFNSLCKTNNNDFKFRNVMGRLHYSNFI